MRNEMINYFKFESATQFNTDCMFYGERNQKQGVKGGAIYSISYTPDQ